MASPKIHANTRAGPLTASDGGASTASLAASAVTSRATTPSSGVAMRLPACDSMSQLPVVGFSMQEADSLAASFDENDMAMPSCILPGRLFLGGKREAFNAEGIQRLGIRAFLNVANGVPRPGHITDTAVAAGHVRYCAIPLHDAITTPLNDHLHAAIHYIDDAVAAGMAVLVFCERGISRSASMVIAYVMHALKVDYNTAHVYVADRHDRAEPNTGFVDQLRDFSLRG